MTRLVPHTYLHGYTIIMCYAEKTGYNYNASPILQQPVISPIYSAITSYQHGMIEGRAGAHITVIHTLGVELYTNS